MILPRVISASLSPNTERDDVIAAIKALAMPWRWKKGQALTRISGWFERMYPRRGVYLFNSGRSALFAILKAFDIKQGDEVLVQAFTCVAVPNSVLWNRATPIYVDIDKTLTMDPIDIQKKITKRTKAIIVQHTLGIPAQMDAIVQIAIKHKLLVFEDCAHSLGGSHKGKPLGSFGDASFFSFGRDKSVSSVWGGAALIDMKHKKENTKLKEFYETVPYPSYLWTGKQLLHPVAFSVILPWYRVGVGKIVLVLLQRLHILSMPVFSEEKNGGQPSEFPKKYPNGLALLLVTQLKKLDRYTSKRNSTAAWYRDRLKKSGVVMAPRIAGTASIRFPIFIDRPDSVIAKAKKKGILLGNWYHNGIDPVGVDFTAIGYNPAFCPNAQKLAKRVVNLPTRISQKEAERVAKLFI